MDWLKSYGKLRGLSVRVVFGEFFLQSVQTSFLLLFNYYLLDFGYNDGDIGELLGWRFFAVMVVALPVGHMIRQQATLPWLRVAGVIIPASSFCALESVSSGDQLLTTLSVIAQGLGFGIMQAVTIPLIMRNSRPEQVSEFMALHFSWHCFHNVFKGVFS